MTSVLIRIPPSHNRPLPHNHTLYSRSLDTSCIASPLFPNSCCMSLSQCWNTSCTERSLVQGTHPQKYTSFPASYLYPRSPDTWGSTEHCSRCKLASDRHCIQDTACGRDDRKCKSDNDHLEERSYSAEFSYLNQHRLARRKCLEHLATTSRIIRLFHNSCKSEKSTKNANGK